MGALLLIGVGVLMILLDPVEALAQQGTGAAGGLSSQSLRPYGHVFVAYALAWVLVLGWIVSLGRRWSRVEDELERDREDE